MPPPTSLGRYRLIRRIARGGMGEVYLALLEATGGVRRPVAVKVLLEGKPSLQAALFAEARLAALIAHPNVVQLFDAGIDGELAWFVMEYVPGLPLSDVLEEGRGRVPPWIWARIVADACAAVHAVHEARDEQGAPLNVVHRDVTPQNLLLSWDGFVKLVDFGIARSALKGSHTTTGVVKGKVGYMSPEQASGATLDRRSDVFALGVLLWEALAGRRLFQRGTEAETLASIVRGDVPPLGEVDPELPEALASVAARALLQSAGARFATALEMQRALELALSSSGLVVGANEVSHAVAGVAPERRREHERWLAGDLEADAAASPSLGVARALTRKLAGATRSRLGSLFLGVRFALGLLIGAGVAVTGFALSREDGKGAPRQEPPAEVGESPTTAGERELGRALSGAPHVSLPETPPSFESAPRPPPPEPALALATNSPPKREPKSSRTPPLGSAARQDPATSGIGTLHVNARPTWATVRIDGQTVGSTPLVVSDVASGAHTIEVSAEGQGPARQRRVMIQPGGIERVDFTLE